MNEHQEVVKRFVQQHGLQLSVEAYMLDLVTHVGDLSKAVLKSTEYGVDPFTPNQEFSKELGDLYLNLIMIANYSRTDLGAALQQALNGFNTLNKSE